MRRSTWNPSYRLLSAATAVFLALAANVSTADSQTVLAIDGTRFTLNGQPQFLVGASYYGGLGASDEVRRADFDKLQKHGFNWVRVWATWAAFGGDMSAVEPTTGEPRRPYLQPCRISLATATGGG